MEAAVPTTVLAQMFGKSAAKVTSDLGLVSNGLMHGLNAAKGIFDIFVNTAPKLGPLYFGNYHYVKQRDLWCGLCSQRTGKCF